MKAKFINNGSLLYRNALALGLRTCAAYLKDFMRRTPICGGFKT